MDGGACSSSGWGLWSLFCSLSSLGLLRTCLRPGSELLPASATPPAKRCLRLTLLPKCSRPHVALSPTHPKRTDCILSTPSPAEKSTGRLVWEPATAGSPHVLPSKMAAPWEDHLLESECPTCGRWRTRSPRTADRNSSGTRSLPEASLLFYNPVCPPLEASFKDEDHSAGSLSASLPAGVLSYHPRWPPGKGRLFSRNPRWPPPAIFFRSLQAKMTALREFFPPSLHGACSLNEDPEGRSQGSPLIAIRSREPPHQGWSRGLPVTPNGCSGPPFRQHKQDG